MIPRIFTLLLILYVFLLADQSHAQKAPLRWGKVTSEELSWLPAGGDNHIEAVMLYDYGMLSYANREEAKLVRHCRIRYMQAPPGQIAKLHLPLNTKRGDRVTRFRAQKISPNTEGKNQVTAVDLDLATADQSSPAEWLNWSVAGVDEGTIIEYQYTVDLGNPEETVTWYFQSALPTMHSEVRLSVSELVKVDLFYRGTVLAGKYATTATRQWILNNLEGIRAEPFSPPPRDYLEQMTFRIAGFYEKGPTYGLDRQMDYFERKSSWNNLAQEFLISSEYRSYLDAGEELVEILQEMKLGEKTDREKVKTIFQLAAGFVLTDSTFSVLPDVKLPGLIRSGKGNGAAINLLLTSLLNRAGLDAAPVLLSTTDHGKVSLEYPDPEQFNHLVAGVKLYGKDLLMDASDKFTAYDLLPLHCLNGQGLWIGKTESHWLDLSSERDRSSFINVDLDLEQPGRGQWTYRAQFSGYAASEKRQQLSRQEMGEVFGCKKLLPGCPGCMTDTIRIEHLLETDRPLKVMARCITNFPDTAEIIILPAIGMLFPANPFVSAHRRLPVDFKVPVEEQYSLTITIPEGYRIEKAPAPYELSLPDGEAVFSYLVGVSGGKIRISYSLKISEYFYEAAEYPSLQEFFGKYFSKLGEAIVLSRDG